MRIVKWDKLFCLSFLLIINIKKFRILTRTLCIPCYKTTFLLIVERILAIKKIKIVNNTVTKSIQKIQAP